MIHTAYTNNIVLRQQPQARTHFERRAVDQHKFAFGVTASKSLSMSNHLRNANVRSSAVAVDLFAGAGGLSLGAYFAGIEVRAAVERNRHACSTYRHNLVETGLTSAKLFERDILELKPDQLMEGASLSIGQCDILLGGPPCQGFSAHRLNNAGIADPRNALILRYFDYVRDLRPKVFLVENVPGMLWPRHRRYVDQFYRLAQQNDYDMLPPIALNARDFGVPQNRKRIFLFGRDRNLGLKCEWPPKPTHYSPQSIQDLAKNDQGKSVDRLEWNNASKVFEIDAPEGDPNNIHMRHGKELTELFRRTPMDGGSRSASGRQLACHLGHDGHSDVYGRIALGTQGPTMTTACINPSKGRFVHPTEPHGITVRQAARFQTFPDWFIFHGGLMSAGEQIGNAVPVQMAHELLRPIAEIFRTLNKFRRPD